jgi:hypothetical protein
MSMTNTTMTKKTLSEMTLGDKKTITKKLRIAIICDPLHDMGGALISTLRFSKKN